MQNEILIYEGGGITIHEKKRKELVQINFFFLSTLFFYISLFSFVYICEKHNIFSSAYYVANNDVGRGMQVPVMLLLTIIVGSISLLASNLVFSKTFNILSEIYKSLPKVDFTIKIVCYIVSCYVLSTVQNVALAENIAMAVIFLALALSIVIGVNIKKTLLSKSNHDIETILKKNSLELSVQEKIKYEKAQKLFSNMFWLIIIFCGVFFKYLFFNTVVLSIGLFLSLMVVLYMAYRAYSLIFSKRDLLIKIVRTGSISVLAIIFTILLYNHSVTIWFYPSVTVDELRWLILIPYLFFQLPAAKVYTTLNRNKN